jgi:pimeloyl-ACP methyl ester carboxylesterase
MPAFSAADGTELAYHVQGEGIPRVCLPGGPMRDSAYLGAAFAALGSPVLLAGAGGGHFPWLDDASWFASATATFLE